MNTDFLEATIVGREANVIYFRLILSFLGFPGGSLRQWWPCWSRGPQAGQQWSLLRAWTLGGFRGCPRPPVRPCLGWVLRRMGCELWKTPQKLASLSMVALIQVRNLVTWV